MISLARDIEINSAVYIVEKIDILRMISSYHHRRSPRLHTSSVSAQSVIILVFSKSLSIVPCLGIDLVYVLAKVSIFTLIIWKGNDFNFEFLCMTVTIILLLYTSNNIIRQVLRCATVYIVCFL